METTNENLMANHEEILKENRKLKQERLCVICKDMKRERAVLPCAHLCACKICINALKNCPICNSLIKGIIRVYSDF